MIGDEYFASPYTQHLSIVDGRLVWGARELWFLSTDGEGTYHFAEKNRGYIRFNNKPFYTKDRGLPTIYEKYSVSSRSYLSRSGVEQFNIWENHLEELGFSRNVVGFVPNSKFVDGSTSEFAEGDQLYFVIRVEENDVILDGERAVMSVVVMESGASAIELRTSLKTFWLFGGGAFQVSIDGLVKTTFTGIGGTPPSAGAQVRTKLPEYATLYIRLKTIVGR